jgi:hypothetical protein
VEETPGSVWPLMLVRMSGFKPRPRLRDDILPADRTAISAQRRFFA